MAFAGIWTTWTSVRKIKEGEVTADLFVVEGWPLLRPRDIMVIGQTRLVLVFVNRIEAVIVRHAVELVPSLGG